MKLEKIVKGKEFDKLMREGHYKCGYLRLQTWNGKEYNGYCAIKMNKCEYPHDLSAMEHCQSPVCETYKKWFDEWVKKNED